MLWKRTIIEPGFHEDAHRFQVTTEIIVGSRVEMRETNKKDEPDPRLLNQDVSTSDHLSAPLPTTASNFLPVLIALSLYEVRGW